jgi:hypothetical protein
LQNWTQITEGNEQNIILGVKKLAKEWREIKIIIRPVDHHYINFSNKKEFELLENSDNEFWISSE